MSITIVANYAGNESEWLHGSKDALTPGKSSKIVIMKSDTRVKIFSWRNDQHSCKLIYLHLENLLKTHFVIFATQRN